MGSFFEDTMQGLLEAVEIEKGNIPLKEGVKIMATLFQEYVAEERAEERAEEQKKGIRGMVETYCKFEQNAMLAREAVIEKYPEVAETIIDSIVDEVYGL